MSRHGHRVVLAIAAVAVCGTAFLGARFATRRTGSHSVCEASLHDSRIPSAPAALTLQPAARIDGGGTQSVTRPAGYTDLAGEPGSVTTGVPRRSGENTQGGTLRPPEPWKDIAEAFPHANQWSAAFMQSKAFDGIKDNCAYLGQKRPSNVPLIVGITGHSTPDGFQVDDAQLIQQGHADEYQAKCVVQWVTGSSQTLPAGWMDAGRVYRFSFRFLL